MLSCEGMSTAERRPRTSREELAVVIITSIAALATAWCAYEATVWSGIQTFRLAEANDLRRRSVEARLEGTQVVALDVQQFIAWIEARQRGEAQLTSFFFDRFRPELARATTEWLESNPFENESAEPHPFELESYQVADFHRAHALEQRATRVHREAHAANHHADLYMLATVLLAMVLFVVASGPKQGTDWTHRIFLLVTALFLAGALGYVASHPVRWTSGPDPLPPPEPYERPRLAD